jgi:hypothetical protein
MGEEEEGISFERLCGSVVTFTREKTCIGLLIILGGGSEEIRDEGEG